MPDFYLFRHRRVSKRSIQLSYRHEMDLRRERQVVTLFVILCCNLPVCVCLCQLIMSIMHTLATLAFTFWSTFDSVVLRWHCAVHKLSSSLFTFEIPHCHVTHVLCHLVTLDACHIYLGLSEFCTKNSKFCVHNLQILHSIFVNSLQFCALFKQIFPLLKLSVALLYNPVCVNWIFKEVIVNL